VISTQRRRIAWLIALLAVVSVGLVTYASARSYAESEAAVRRTLAVRGAIADTMSLLKDAETGQRGYFLTGDDAFLAPHQKAEREMEAQLQRLDAQTADDPLEKQSTVRVRALARQKLDILLHLIELQRLGRSEEALSIVRDGKGSRVMDALRAETGHMLERESTRLQQHEHDAVSQQKRAISAVCAGLALAVAIALAGLWTIRREAAEVRSANSKLLASEQRLRNLADNAVDLIRIIDAEAHFVYVSPSSVALLGHTPEEIRAMQPYTILHPDDVERARSLTAEVRRTGQQVEPFVHRLRRKDGSYSWVETRIQPAIEEAERVGYLHLTSRDINAQKLAEGALRKQTARFESILSSMGDGVVVMDEERRLLVVNPKAQEYIRQPPGELVPADWSARHATFLPDGLTPFPAEKGPLTRALRGEACEGIEIVIHDLHEEPRSLSVAAHPIRDGEVSMGCVAVYRDVTQQRRSEKELAENEQRLRVLAEATFEGLAITKNGRVVDANANFLNWVGRDLSELIGTEGLSLFAAEDREHVARASSRELVYEARLLRRDGTTLPVEVRGSAAKLHGEVVRIASLRDLTERKKREQDLVAHAEQLRALSLRDELTGLYNRRGFMEHARQQLRTSARVQRTATLFFADMNGLKIINDGLGHEAGDRAIASAAAVLCTLFRKSDIVARLGGDEFAVVALDCDAKQLPIVRARLDTILNDFNSRTPEQFRLSMSMGAAVYDTHAPIELERLLEIADARMYDDKRAHAQSSIARSGGVS